MEIDGKSFHYVYIKVYLQLKQLPSLIYSVQMFHNILQLLHETSNAIELEDRGDARASLNKYERFPTNRKVDRLIEKFTHCRII